MSAIRHVIWDFNGTLLDDVDCCVATLNTLLGERALPAISRAEYQQRFGFPVRDFYVDLGFDFAREQFERVSEVFIARYRSVLDGALLAAGALDLLAELRRRAIGQSVVSAMEQLLLGELLERFGLHGYMTHVRGLDHLGASSKIELGLTLQRELRLAPEELLLVGDTLHDLELARALGCRCLLYAGGHQTRSRLERSGAQLIDSLGALLEVLDGDAPKAALPAGLRT
jgi:phosphoglycolate phosphatase